jgi:hypothetical protein
MKGHLVTRCAIQGRVEADIRLDRQDVTLPSQRSGPAKPFAKNKSLFCWALADSDLQHVAMRPKHAV